jgi:hypothetical protein
MGSSRRRLLNPSTLSKVANSTASRLRQGLRRRLEPIGGIPPAEAEARYMPKAGLGQAFGVFDGNGLGTTDAMVNEAASPDRPAMVERLIERIEDEVGLDGTSAACVAPASRRCAGRTRRGRRRRRRNRIWSKTPGEE